MPDIDNLSIKIKADSDTANRALSDLIENLEKMTSALQSVGRVQGFSKTNDFAKRTSQTFESISKQFEGLGKGFQIKGDFSQVTKGLNTLENNLAKAKVKEEELHLGGKTDTAGYENAVKDIVKYTNMIDSVRSGMEQADKAAQAMASSVAQIHVEPIAEKIENVDAAMKRAADSTRAFTGEWGGVPLPDFSEETYKIHTMTGEFEVVDGKIHEVAQSAAEMGRVIQNAVSKPFTGEWGGIELPNLDKIDTGSFANLQQKLSQLVIPPIDETNLDKLEASLKRSEEQLEKFRAKLENGITMGRITESEDDKTFVKMQEEIALLEKQIEELKARIADIKAPPSVGLFDSIKQFPAMVGDVFKNLPRLAIKGIGTALKGAANIGIKGFQTLGKVGMSALKGIGNLAGKIGSKFASMLNPFKKLTSASKGMNVSLAGGFKTVLKYAFGIRSLFTLFNKLRNAVKEGMKNLVQYSDETNASVSMLTNSMTQLKNSVAAEVSPLLNALAPALDFIIQLCIKAVNAINQLISALLGKAAWIHAKKLTDSYRDSLNGVSKAAEKVQKGVRAFDELNLITTPDDNDGGSGAGTSAADMFETLDVEKPFSDLAERIKEMWAKADFTELGAMVGGKIKAGLESIDWGTIQGNVARVSKSLATFINGLVEVEGLGYTVGTSIGNGFNTALIAVNTFLDNTHWDSIGTFIGEGLNGVVDTVDWGGIGHMFAQKWNAIFEVLGNIATTFDWKNFGLSLAESVNTFIDDFDWAENGARLSDLAKGLLDSIIYFLENTNWQELGEKVKIFIQNIDWTGLAERLAEGIGAALGGLAGFIWGLIGEAWQNVVDWWYDTAYEDGDFTMKGLLEGIWNKIKDIGTWIKEHIFQPFIDGFKKAFGIASPSKVMEEQGNFIMEGLFNGISSLVDKVVGIFGDIKTKISEKWNEIKTNTVQIWENIKTWISETWNNIKTSIFSSIENVKSFVSNAWENIRNVTSNIWGGIRDTISNVAQSISNIVGGIFDKIGQVKDKISDFTNSIKSIDISAPSFITGGISSIFSGKVKGYASGGFIENPHSYSLFMAGENGIPEMLGTIGGQPAVAGGQEITGISDTIRYESERDRELLRQLLPMVQQLCEKEYGITKDEIGQAARDYSREYFDKNGKPAFAY